MWLAKGEGVLMMQIVYGWKGIPHQGSVQNPKYRYVHLPQETFQNQYRPWDAGADPYVGEIHEDVDRYETRTTTLVNDVEILTAQSHRMWCSTCQIWNSDHA